MLKSKFLFLLLSLLLVGCGGSGVNSGTGKTSASGYPVQLVVAAGAPLVNVPFTITKWNGTVVTTGTVANDAMIGAELTAAGAPYIISVTDTGVTPNVVYKNIILASDFNSSGIATLNVTPLSTIVTNIVLNSLASTTTPTNEAILAARTAAADAVKTAIQPLLDAAKVTGISSGTDLIKYVFTPTSDPLDKVLDTIDVACNQTTKTCSITPSSAKANAAVGGALSISTASTTAAQTDAAAVKSKLTETQETISTMLETVPVVVVFGATSQWGTATDTWAGYSGKFTIYNFSDQPVNAGTLYFESKLLTQQSFWDVQATVAGGKYSLVLPTWANIKPRIKNTDGTLPAPASYAFGFQGTGFAGSVTDFANCNINGQKCIILMDDKSLDLSKMTASDRAIRSWSNFKSTLPKEADSSKVVDNKVDPNTSNNNSTNNNTSNDSSNGGATTTPVAKVAIVATSSWTGGFNGELQLTNSSSSPWTSWSVSFTMPSSVSGVSSWGNYKLTSSGQNVTFANEAWNGAIAAGKQIKFGFGGSGTLISTGAAITNCKISINGAPLVACDSASTIADNSNTNNNTNSNTDSNTNNNTTPTPPTPPAPPAPPSDNNTTPVAGAEPTKVSESKYATQGGRTFVGYYPSWSDNWFSSTSWDNKALDEDAILKASKLARVPGTYTHIVAAFAKPDFTWSTATNFTGNKWDGTGLNFNAGPKDIKEAIKVLQKRGMKVLVAVGGATYNEWGDLAAEGNALPGGSKIKINALKQMMIDVGFDGLDVDYEVEGTKTAEYKGAVNAMYEAVRLANLADTTKTRTLALAGWSTGADCTATTGSTGCGGKISYWGGKAGGERLVFSDPEMAKKIDMVSIMSYDARFEHYDGVKAYQLYRELFPSTTIVNIGLETAPEGWAGAFLVVEDSHAVCTGATIEKDQMGNEVKLPYSVNRYVSAVKNYTGANRNDKDGAMIWEVLKKSTLKCGANTVASPGTITAKVSTILGLTSDPRTAWQ